MFNCLFTCKELISIASSPQQSPATNFLGCWISVLFLHIKLIELVFKTAKLLEADVAFKLHSFFRFLAFFSCNNGLFFFKFPSSYNFFVLWFFLWLLIFIINVLCIFNVWSTLSLIQGWIVGQLLSPVRGNFILSGFLLSKLSVLLLKSFLHFLFSLLINHFLLCFSDYFWIVSFYYNLVVKFEQSRNWLEHFFSCEVVL
jgi:hypothetical protein